MQILFKFNGMDFYIFLLSAARFSTFAAKFTGLNLNTVSLWKTGFHSNG